MKILKKIRDKLFLNALRNDIHKELNLFFREHQKWVQDCVNNSIYSQLQYALADSSRLNTVVEYHKKTFLGFKNKFQGKKVVIIGGGPSVNQFIPIENAIYIGLNRAFKYEKVIFDYLFTIDWWGLRDYAMDFFSYKKGKCLKFVGDQNTGSSSQIPESIINGDDVRRFFTHEYAGGKINAFSHHIETEPLGNWCSVAFQALQFALYTNPKIIYLVGLDSTGYGHFVGVDVPVGYDQKLFDEVTKNNIPQLIKDYNALKEFANTYYPNTEIISVNPVNLRGIFKDWDQYKGDAPK